MQPEQTESTPQQPPSTPTEPKPPSSKKKIIKVLVVLFVFCLVAGVIYYLQQQKVDKLNKSNQDISAQLESAKRDKQETTTEEAKPVEASTNVVYNAKVGKFTLTLPEKYVVVQKNDGGGEGGPSTILLFAEKSSTAGILLSPIWDEVTMTAHPLQGGIFRENVDGTLKDRDPQKQASVTIDGITAEVYLLNGFSQPKHIYFTKNDIMYSIEAVDNSESANKKIDAIVAGFKFN